MGYVFFCMSFMLINAIGSISTLGWSGHAKHISYCLMPNHSKCSAEGVWLNQILKSLKLVYERGANQLMITVQCVSIGSTHVLFGEKVTIPEVHRPLQNLTTRPGFGIAFFHGKTPACWQVPKLSKLPDRLCRGLVSGTIHSCKAHLRNKVLAGAVASEHVRTVEGVWKVSSCVESGSTWKHACLQYPVPVIPTRAHPQILSKRIQKASYWMSYAARSRCQWEEAWKHWGG